jgi:hypothetical protein
MTWWQGGRFSCANNDQSRINSVGRQGIEVYSGTLGSASAVVLLMNFQQLFALDTPSRTAWPPWMLILGVCRDLDNTGTDYLSKKLSTHLINEITRKLPEIQSYIDKT